MNAAPFIPASGAVQRWPRSLATVGRARHELAEVLRGSGLGHLAEAATVVLSELMTNALQHVTETEGGEIETRFAAAYGQVRIEVRDAGSGQPHRRKAATDDEDGRGLALVDALTAGRWGVHNDTQGKAVWAVVGTE